MRWIIGIGSWFVLSLIAGILTGRFIAWGSGYEHDREKEWDE